ncbi:hypothetical protein VUR80DRAFT_7588 [Thermomyces stellatus]
MKQDQFPLAHHYKGLRARSGRHPGSWVGDTHAEEPPFPSQRVGEPTTYVPYIAPPSFFSFSLWLPTTVPPALEPVPELLQQGPLQAVLSNRSRVPGDPRREGPRGGCCWRPLAFWRLRRRLRHWVESAGRESSTRRVRPFVSRRPVGRGRDIRFAIYWATRAAARSRRWRCEGQPLGRQVCSAVSMRVPRSGPPCYEDPASITMPARSPARDDCGWFGETGSLGRRKLAWPGASLAPMGSRCSFQITKQ